jgi:hypothetical protein
MIKGKAECMLFGTKPRIKEKELHVEYKGNTVSNTSSFKYLGVQLDQSVTLHGHLDVVYKKVCGRLYLLKRVRGK